MCRLVVFSQNMSDGAKAIVKCGDIKADAAKKMALAERLIPIPVGVYKFVLTGAKEATAKWITVMFVAMKKEAMFLDMSVSIFHDVEHVLTKLFDDTSVLTCMLNDCKNGAIRTLSNDPNRELPQSLMAKDLAIVSLWTQTGPNDQKPSTILAAAQTN